MQDNNHIFPALEQGIRPLEKLGGVFHLPPENLYSQARVLLATALEQTVLEEMGHLIPALSSPENRRDLSLLRRLESHQLASLSPIHFAREDVIRRALFLSVLSMELTAVLAQCLRESPLRQTLHFLLPEFLDETYRLSNLLLLLDDVPSQDILAGYCEIMPGRPMISCHRHPYDEICPPLLSQDPLENMAPLLLASVLKLKRQHYQQASASTEDALARSLFLEISLISEAQQTRMLSLFPARSPLSQIHLAQYTEVYLYDSLARDEEIPFLRQLYLEEKENEGAHLQKIIRMMESVAEDIPSFSSEPERLRLGPNKGYIRDILQHVGVTAQREKYVPVGMLPEGADFFRYQQRICPHPEEIPSHLCVEGVIKKFGMDYRFEIAPHPIERLRDRSKDHLDIGR